MKAHYSDVWQAVVRALPDRPAIVTRDEIISYGRFAREAGALAGQLRLMGLKPGDSLAILLYNRPEYVVALFACLASGIAPVPINYRYRAAEVAELLSDSGAAALLFPTSLADIAHDAAEQARTSPALIQIDDGGTPLQGVISWQEVLASGGELPASAPEGGELRLYTGGTTGKPKAVVWGDDDLFEVQLYSIYEAAGLRSPETVAEAARIAADPATSRVATLPLAPLMHGTALFSTLNTLALGGTVILHSASRLDADEAVRLAIDARATRIIVAGDAIALPLADAAERAGFHRLGSVNSVISSGMRLSETSRARLHALGDITIIDLLASTEGGPFAVAVTHSLDDLPARLELLPGAVVLDDDRNEVQDVVGALGILAFNGALPKGYFRDEAKTLATFPQIRGVRHVVPGDWVRVRPAHHIELLGRGSAVINTGGEKVFPAEVEEALLSYPTIGDAVVFGLPDERFGEVVSAVVVPNDRATVDAGDVLTHVDRLLAGYKKPRHLVIRDSLERSPHGKIDMRSLIAEVASELNLEARR